MNDQYTQIQYAEVKNSVNTLRNVCLANMRNIFSDFEQSMNKVGADNVFVGDASQTLRARFNGLSAKFKDFQDLVNRFASQLEGASASTASTEQSLADAAQNLNAGNAGK